MITKETYQEVYEVLSLMDKKTVMKIPLQILEKIKNKRDKNFKTSIDKKDIFNENNLREQSVDLLCWLNYSYLIDENQRKLIDTRIENIKRIKYNPNNLFNNRNNSIKQCENQNEYIRDNNMIIYKESIIKKIINFIKKKLKHKK